MPAKAIEPPARHYPISNDWLNQFAHDATKYIDIREIKQDPASSQYLRDLVSMGVTINLNAEREKANFHLQAVYIGSVASGQNNMVRGRLAEDSYNDTWPVAAASYLQVKMERVYANGTDARDIKFTGFLENS